MMDKAEVGKEVKETEQVMEGDSTYAQADAVRKLILAELRSVVDEEMRKAAQELLEEQRMVIRQVVEEQKKIIREVVEEIRKAIWAGALEEQKNTTRHTAEEEQAVWAGVEEMKDSIPRIGLN